MRGSWLLFFGALVACEARISVGARCERSSECEAPLVCAGGRCRVECVAHADCSLGARCVNEPISGAGRCTLPDDPDCRDVGSECEAGLLCIAGTCLNACEDAASCPVGSACVPDAMGRAYCEREERAPDASAVDADQDEDAPPESLDVGASDAGVCVGPACDPPVALALVPSGSCALTASGSVWCWGAESVVGSGATFPTCPEGVACTPSPVRVVVETGGATHELRAASALAGGRTFGAIDEGRLVGWGAPARTLGTTGDGRIARPTRLASGGLVPPTVEAIMYGFTSAYARMADGSGWMWGDEDFAQRGEGIDVGSDFLEAADPAAGGSVPSLGAWHGCTVVAGIVRCWGENDLGQAGGADVGPGEVVVAPTTVVGVPPGATEVVAGRSQSCALVAGDVYCWGASYAIGTAVAPPGCVTTPDGEACPTTPIAWAGGAFTHLFGGPYTNDTCAIDAAGRLYCWGAATTREPMLVSLPGPVTVVALADLHGCAIAAGDVVCWGMNPLGQLGIGGADTTVHGPTAVAWPE